MFRDRRLNIGVNAVYVVNPTLARNRGILGAKFSAFIGKLTKYVGNGACFLCFKIKRISSWLLVGCLSLCAGFIKGKLLIIY
jgi:hypothetical protein